MHARIIALAFLVALAPAAQSLAAERSWPDTAIGRQHASALIEELNGDLLASSSATATLEAWCVAHRIAMPARMRAIVAGGAGKPASPAVRAMLNVGAAEPLRYRRVFLACGDHTLSQAENWYVPARLTPAMNHMLATTTIPFGRVIAPLAPSRRTLSVQHLWTPLPPGGGNPAMHFAGARQLAIPKFLLRHRAIVLDRAHRPIAFVAETYTRAVLDFVHSQ